MTSDHQLFCEDEVRRAKLRKSAQLNGIDYIEIGADEKQLDVYFIGQGSLTTILGDLKNDPRKITIEGGARVRNIWVVSADRVGDHLRLIVSEAGDFSNYTLVINHTALDDGYTRCEFNFRAGCPSRFDCRTCLVCPTHPRDEPLIDYMAKDYASFRQALLDLIPTLVPNWTERHEADLGITLAELLAYLGDYLSYYQDAVANEAYLATARQRISVRRLARLIDYRVHDGASARSFIHVQVDSSGTIPVGTQVLTKINVPLGARLPPHTAVLGHELTKPALDAADAVFETMDELATSKCLNEIPIYTWGNDQCCLTRGATSVDLSGNLKDLLHVGDFLLLEEVIGPESGLPADVDRTHRQIVRLTSVHLTEDRLLAGSTIASSPPIPLTRVTWDRADALTFPLCLSAKLPNDSNIDNVSVARGNLVLADHGRTREEWFPVNPTTAPGSTGITTGDRPFRFPLKEGPLSFRIPSTRDLAVRDLLIADPRQLEPLLSPCLMETSYPIGQVQLSIQTSTETIRIDEPQSDLLESDEFARDFVVETDNEGRALVRFGDDTFGAAPPDGAHIKATYRVGVGTSGNVGADSLIHVIDPGNASFWPAIKAVRNPLAAWGGVEPESIDEVKHLAPAAFRAAQYRAVTEVDYANAAELHPEVSKAVATFRWTGSWLTVFLTIDPVGRGDVSEELERKVIDWVTCYTQTGYDLEIDPPMYVSLDIEMDVCVKPGYFRGDVEQAVLIALSNQDFIDGGRGFFHVDKFTFGQGLYLSNMYAAVEAVEGVDSAVVTRFRRFGRAANNELAQASIPMGRLEIVRLDNDPSFPEHGVLNLNMQGGK